MDDNPKDNNHRYHALKRNRWASITIALIILILGAGLGAYLYTHRDPYKPARAIPYSDVTSYAPTLHFLDALATQVPSIDNMKVFQNSKGLKVVNSSSDNWTNCNPVSVNDYYYDTISINAGSTKVLFFRDFTRVDMRLNTQSIKPAQFTIQCDIGTTNYANAFSLN